MFVLVEECGGVFHKASGVVASVGPCASLVADPVKGWVCIMVVGQAPDPPPSSGTGT